jgi:hypothetical protein
MARRGWTWQRQPVPIPDEVKNLLRERLENHIKAKWKGKCKEFLLRFRGAFAYVDVIEEEDSLPNLGEERQLELSKVPSKLCRLAYQGSIDRWEFAFYKYSDERYELCYLPNGSFIGTPEECFDCAARVYL